MELLTIFAVLLNVVLIQSKPHSSIAHIEDLSEDARIIQGWPVVQGQFRFVVRLHIPVPGGTRLCGGSLISTRYVLTAAHCLFGSSSVEVRMGSVNSNTPSRTVTTSRFNIHEGYYPPTMRNDIALIDMQTDIPASANIGPIKLAKINDMSTSFENMTATVAGWGSTTDNGNQSQIMNYVNLTIISNAKCQEDYGSIVYDSTVCAVGIQSPSQSSCHGDSGGPLFMPDPEGGLMQVGIVSFVSMQGCSAGTPSGYVRPHYYWVWIWDWTKIPIRI